MKIKFGMLALAILSFSLFMAVSAANAQTAGNCGSNFTASYNYERIIATPPTTTIVPQGSSFATKLTLEANGSDLMDEGDNVDVVLVMDRSGSMRQEIDGIQKIEKAKEALRNVVGIFNEVDKPENRLALITYSSDVTVDQALTSQDNYQGVLDAIDSFVANGTTNIGGALQVASNHLRVHSQNESKKFIVIATDGVPNRGVHYLDGIAAVGENVTVFSIGIGESSRDYNPRILREISQAGSGEGEFLEAGIGNLPEVFEEIIRDILTPFRAEDISLTFYRENAANFDVAGTNPNSSGVSSAQINWANIGSMDNNSPASEIGIDFRQIGPPLAAEIPVNKNYLRVEYSLFGTSCLELVPIDVVMIGNFQCTGAVSPTWQLCDGDDENLVADSSNLLVGACTDSRKCEFICRPPYEYHAGQCKLRASCGALEDNIWCRSQPGAPLCDSGNPMSIPTAHGDRWTWYCGGSGYITASCSAKRLCPSDWQETLP